MKNQNQKHYTKTKKGIQNNKKKKARANLIRTSEMLK